MILPSDINVIALSSINWKPVFLKSQYNTVNIEQQTVTYSNGVQLNLSPLYQNTKDVAINNNSLLLLTDNKPVKGIFKEERKDITVDSKKLINFTTLTVPTLIPKVTASQFINIDGVFTENIVTLEPEKYIHKQIVSDSTIRLNNIPSFLKKDIFKLNFAEDYVIIQNLEDFYITYIDNSIFLTKENYPDSQKFNYILNDISITLFKYNTNYTEVLNTNTELNTINFEPLMPRFNSPLGLVKDSNGNLFVSDTNNHVIRKVTPAGVVSTFAGVEGVPGNVDGTGVSAKFAEPAQITIDTNNNLYVADSVNNSVRKITSAGVVSTIAGTGEIGSLDGPTMTAKFKRPCGIAIDTNNNIFVADTYNHTIRKITTSGDVSTFAGTPETLGSIDGPQSTRFCYPVGLVIDSNNNIYVADTINCTVRKVTPTKVVSTIAGSPGLSGWVDGDGKAARFNSPYGIAIDNHNNIYVADNKNHAVRKITSAGVVSTYAGTAQQAGLVNGPTTTAKFNLPANIVIDSSGDIYVCDSANHSIRKITSLGYVNTYTGSGISGITNGVSRPIPANSILYIEYLKDLQTYIPSVQDSFIAKYTTNTLSARNTLELDQHIKNTPYKQNYLINIPIYNSKFYDNNQYIAYINSLKNYQTYNYEYSIANERLHQRQYTNLFVGNNQKTGHNNIYLNYTADTFSKTFAKDTNTIFHYPATMRAEGIRLSSSGLLEEGAIANKVPYISDRISYHQKDYRELGLDTAPNVTDGTWVCAWLSARDDGSATWMDRYYRGAMFDATTQEYLLHTVNDPLIVDTPSTIKLLPNRVYSYFHQGQQNYKNYVQTFENIHRDKSTKILDIDDWSSNILIDKSTHKNNGILTLNTLPLTTEYLVLDGKGYAMFPASLSLEEDKQLTIGFWYHLDDWKQSQGTQIFGNFSDGGVGLYNKQNSITPFITLYDSNNGYVYNFNTDLKIISEQKNLNTHSKSTYVAHISNQNYWLIDNNTLKAYLCDLNDNIINTIDLSHMSTISQIELDNLENIYVVDNATNTICIFNGYNGYVYSRQVYLPANYNRIELVTNYNPIYKNDIIYVPQIKGSITTIVGLYAQNSVTDKDNNIWSSIGINIYKNKDYFASVGRIVQLTCDREGNVWAIHDRDKITKINSNKNIIEFTLTLNSAVFEQIPDSQTRFINFITRFINNKETDFAIIIDNSEKMCYLLDLQGNIYNKTNLLSIPTTYLSKHNFNRAGINFTGYGDFTGYQYQRKFNNSSEFVWKLYLTLSSNTRPALDSTIVSLPFDVSSYEPGWHYLALVFDHIRGSITAYTDGIVVNSYKFKEGPFSYRIKTSSKAYTVGAVTSGRGILNDNTVSGNTSNSIIGKFAKLHIYKHAFDKYDIRALFNSSYVDMFNDLIWNIPTGNRNYIEQIERFFMHKMPGNKSKFFNIKIKNFAASNKQKEIIEQAIHNTIKKIAPADTSLHLIKWV